MWNSARNAGHFERALTLKGIRYPKSCEKPAFQTWAEIDRKIARRGLTSSVKAELWDCLFLTLPDVDNVLAIVETTARNPFIHPMVVCAAHTCARRGEHIALSE